MTLEVLFVGAGPGDPDLITVAGQKALSKANLIVMAGSLVNPAIITAHANPEATIIDSAPLTLEAIVGHLIEGYQKGLKVVRLHTGDPSLYGAIQEQMALLTAAKVPYRVIPGVTSALAGAAALGLEWTIPEVTQTLILTRAAGRTPMPNGEDLESLAQHQASLAIYLSAAQGPEVSRALSAAYGPEAPVAIGYRLTWPDERLIWATAGTLAPTLKAHDVIQHALILIGPAVAILKSGKVAPKSRLYAAEFTHGHRAGS
ncbi:MAG: precorrin-4 C(11)-methyltransferase [Deltaproteobacteria bacterium]|jgi:precorrin-4/cobalt-precorrin-4 C11-methyltransferase|nr:precorrin-4 C(11)-methyltransferase [Deltaproteobacteria bacterium]